MYSKSMRTETVFTKIEKKNLWNVKISQKNEMYSKSMKTETVFTKIEKKNAVKR